MIIKDEAIALRAYPYGNTSQIVVWLSQTHGKIATLAKGSQRARSGLLGQYDLFYTCEVLFYAREQRNLHILKECCPVAPRRALRHDWRACAVASYATNAVDQLAPFGPAMSGLYDLLARTLDSLAGRTPGPAFLPRFELLLLHELGLAPDWRTCAKCRQDLHERGGRWDVAHGALRCVECAEGSGLEVSAAALRAIETMQGAALPAALPERVFREIQSLAGSLLEHQADCSTVARTLAFQVLAAG